MTEPATAPRLSRAHLPVPGIRRPAAVPEQGIVHLGLGNFHRAHQAVLTAEALQHEPGPWGITGVATSRRAHARPVIAEMAAQDGLYTVLTLAGGGSVAAEVPGVHGPGLSAREQGAEVVAALGSATTRIVTLTVTEKGYRSGPGGALDTDDPEVAADLAGVGPPRTTPGLLVRGLQQRVRSHAAPLTLLSCDNLSDNGAQLARLLREFTEGLPAAEREELLPYLSRAVATPGSMVDRIVPATTEDHRDLVARCFGLRDTVPVPAEPYRLWVVQDEFAAGRPAWERAAGAVLAASHEEVSAYELMKLRLLNGAHSLLAYLGLLGGHALMADAASDPALHAVVRHAMLQEILPTLTPPPGVDGPGYVEELLTRFTNRALGHRTAQVAADGSLKIPVRWPAVLAHGLRAGDCPPVVALGLAAYLHVVTGGTEAYDAAALGEVCDPAAGRLRALAARAVGGRQRTALLLAEGGLLPPPLATDPALVTAVAEHAEALARHGAHQVTASLAKTLADGA
ncbi:mannitol dehydrogenase family protein [Streptomyces sp. NPDC059740]|uniref:mannitol dehydrogenase family protein n=1 Tax=Streptomyces sp. NPDC059740 TaxID=3346926 RepID=UPI00364B34C2